MEFHCPGLSGSAESAGRRPEHEAPAAAGGATPVPVRSAPHRWAPGGPGAEAGWGEQRGSTCGAVGDTRPPTVAGRGGQGLSVLPPATGKVPGTQPTPFLPRSSGPPRPRGNLLECPAAASRCSLSQPNTQRLSFSPGLHFLLGFCGSRLPKSVLITRALLSQRMFSPRTCWPSLWLCH